MASGQAQAFGTDHGGVRTRGMTKDRDRRESNGRPQPENVIRRQAADNSEMWKNIVVEEDEREMDGIDHGLGRDSNFAARGSPTVEGIRMLIMRRDGGANSEEFGGALIPVNNAKVEQHMTRPAKPNERS